MRRCAMRTNRLWELRAAPGFSPAGSPEAHGPQPCGYRVRGAIRQVVRDSLLPIGGHQHVVIGQTLGEDRHLLLGLHDAGIGLARAKKIRAPSRCAHRKRCADRR